MLRVGVPRAGPLGLPRQRGRVRLIVRMLARAERQAKGQRFETEQVSVSTSLGSGSFGEVFRVSVST